MPFIDDLTIILNLMILVCAVVFYTGVLVWWHTRKKDRLRANSHLREGAFLLALLGGILGAIALWGEFTWPIQAAGVPALSAYNLYFFDPLLMLGLLLVAFGVTVWVRLPTHFVGMMGLVMGAGIAYYGVRAELYLSLTKDPMETLLLYLGFGAIGILSVPATLYIDWFVTGPTEPKTMPLPSDPEPASPRLWSALLIVFLAVVVLAGIAALLYGFHTAWSHLENPP